MGSTLSSFHRGMILFTLVMLTFVEILDITIVSVSLLDIKGALGANSNQITWTMTSYTIAAAMVMPLAGYLSDTFGRKRLVLLSALGFGVSSFLCGFSNSLETLVFFRILQGLSGALLPVLAQSILITTFPQEKRNQVMAIYGLGITIAPIMGPVVGGFITDTFGWQWIFFVNVPICLIMFFLANFFLQESPKKERHADWLGMGILAIAVCLMQIVLDKGNDEGWFSSNEILFSALASGFFWIVFIVRGYNNPKNIVRFSAFKDRNFVLSCLSMVFCSAIVFGSFTWVPLWLELVMGYLPRDVGLIMFPRGVVAGITMICFPLLMKFIGPRMALGIFAVVFCFTFSVFSSFNTLQGPSTFFWPHLLMGVAGGLFFVPLASLAYSTLSPALRDEASGIYNFSRSLGTSIGVAIFSLIMSEESEHVWNHLSTFVREDNPAFQTWLSVHHFLLQTPIAYPVLAKVLYQQSMMQAFIDACHLFGWAVLCLIPLLFFFKVPKIDKNFQGEHRGRTQQMGEH
jgi:DHA2 family multidrug resistance protein